MNQPTKTGRRSPKATYVKSGNQRFRVYQGLPLPTGPYAPPPPQASAHLTGVVARREITTQLRSRAFRISTAVMLIAIIGGFIIAGLVGGSGSATGPDGQPAVSDQPAVAADATAQAQLETVWPGSIVPVSSQDEAKKMIQDGQVEAAVMTTSPADQPWSALVIADTAAPDDLVEALTIRPEVELLNPDDNDPFQAYMAMLIFGVLYLMMAQIYGNVTAQNTVVEKQTRIVEILLAAIPARVLLAGKVLGISAVAVGQAAVLALAAWLTAKATGATGMLGEIGAPIAWYVAFFAIGFVLLAALYAGTASLSSRMEDVAYSSMPVTMLVAVPYILAVTAGMSETPRLVMSFIPFTAPVVMPGRILLGTVALWEILVSLGLLLITTAGLVMLAAKVYERSILRTGARIKLAQALKSKP